LRSSPELGGGPVEASATTTEAATYLFPFERLTVWSRAKELATDVVRIAGQFPARERFTLAAQLSRAVLSVASNVAEGSSRYSGRDQARFSEIAYGSLMESVCQLVIAQDLGYVTTEEYVDLRARCEEISRMLTALRASQLRRVER
jgi:four helix bundle protein